VKRFAHSRPQLDAAGACQSNLRRDKVGPPQFCNFTGPVDCFTNRRRSVRNSDPQRIGWTSKTFANYREVNVQYYSLSLGSAAVDAYDGTTRNDALRR